MLRRHQASDSFLARLSREARPEAPLTRGTLVERQYEDLVAQADLLE